MPDRHTHKYLSF